MGNEMSMNQSLQRLRTLPAMPRIAQQILALKIASEEGEQALLDLIKQDPAISAKVVGLANSPVFGASRKISSVNDAAARLGIKKIKMVALSSAMMSSMVRTPHGLLDANSLWKHSLAIILTMQTLFQHMPAHLRPAEDEVFLTGLLHDIGFLVLDVIEPELSDSFHAMLAAKPDKMVEEIEADMLELNHAELGAELAKHWGLPDSIVDALRDHHQAPGPHAPLANIVGLAEKLLPTFREPDQTSPITQEEWSAIGIEPDVQLQVIEKARQHQADAAAGFS